MALTKIDDRGLKTPIDLLDNEKIRLGTGNDLELYHDGSHSYIKDTGTGNLQIVSNQTNIQDADLSHYQAKFIDGGAVELYHSGTKKFETHSEGTYHYGHSTFIIGDEGESAQLFLHADQGDDNADKWKISSAAGGNFYLQNYTSGSWESNLIAYGNAQVELYYDNSKKFETWSGGAQCHGSLHTDELVLQDNEKIKVGTGADLEIYHESDENIIKSTSTGDFKIKTDTTINITKGSSEDIAKFIPDGACELWHNNSKKFETTSAGIEVTGRIALMDSSDTSGSGNALWLGAGNDLKIFHDGSHSRIIDSGTGNLIIQTSKLNINNAAGDEGLIHATENGKVELYYDNSLKFETTSSGTTVSGDILVKDSTPALTLQDTNDSDTLGIVTHTSGNLKIHADYNNVMAGSSIRFTVDGTEQARIADGISFNGDSATANFLNDYEEGTWTPTSNVGSITVATAHYVKIGSLVMAQAYVTFPSMSGAAAVELNGYPFATANSTDFHSAAVNSNANLNTQLCGQFVNSQMLFATETNDKANVNQLSSKFVVVSVVYTTH